jgi:Xaa-Pro aminopeptidase
MGDYRNRMTRFQALIADKADLVFVHRGTDLDYLTGLHRDLPNYGRNIHPGDWLQGAWISPATGAILALPRITTDITPEVTGAVDDVWVLTDWDTPEAMLAGIVASMRLPKSPLVAISDNAEAQTLVKLQELIPDVRFTSATRLLMQMRVIKSASEIETLRIAGKMTEAALAATIGNLRIGMTELDIVTELDYQMRRQGSLGPTFATTLYVSGPNHPMIFRDRLATWPRKLVPPVSVLLDFGAVHDGMCYDYGRTVCFGAPPAEQIRVHEMIMRSQAAGIAALRSGATTCEAVDKASRDVIVRDGYGPKFRHRLGHAIGWDVHEPPFLSEGDTTTVQDGMVFTVEPSVWQDGSYSARVEDCVVVRAEGGEKLTNGFQDLIVVE